MLDMISSFLDDSESTLKSFLVLFSISTFSALGNPIHFCGLKCHLWADDSQIYLFSQDLFSKYIQ